MIDEDILIRKLFNLGIDLGFKFKHCKNCNHLFIVTHNRQMHCTDKCRREYKDQRHNQKNFEERQIQRSDYLEYYDNNGNWVVVRSDQLQLGSMRTGLREQRHKNFSTEERVVRNQLKALGLRSAS